MRIESKAKGEIKNEKKMMMMIERRSTDCN